MWCESLVTHTLKVGTLRGLPLKDELASYQLVGGVMAYQGI